MSEPTFSHVVANDAAPDSCLLCGYEGEVVQNRICLNCLAISLHRIGVTAGLSDAEANMRAHAALRSMNRGAAHEW